MIYLTNAFSLNMLGTESEKVDDIVYFREINLSEAKRVLSDGFVSAIGHADLAAILSEQLECEVLVNRISVKMERDVPLSEEGYPSLLIAQYSGPRLPEGATALPEGAIVKFILAENICGGA